MIPRRVFWPLFAALMGFVVGGSFVSALQQPSYLHNFIEHPTEWLLVAFNFWLALFTMRLFYATSGQVAETRRIGEAQVRAYVDIRDVAIFFVPLVDVPNAPELMDVYPIIRIAVRNTGQSPARNFVWNPAVQYFGVSAANSDPKPGIGELGADWRERRGAGISVGGDHIDSAMISGLALNRYLTEQRANTSFFVLQLRVRFEFEDVFDQRIVDEAYFSGGFRKNINSPPVKTDFGDTQWTGKLIRIDKPRDWPTIKTQSRKAAEDE